MNLEWIFKYRTFLYYKIWIPDNFCFIETLGALKYILCMYVNVKLFLGPKTGIYYLLIFPLYFSEFPLYILRERQ